MNKIDITKFWEWAFSDILNNTTRGKFAEYLVFTACKRAGLDIKQCSYWDSWDLEIVGGLKIEVKASSNIQSWGDSKPKQNNNPVFSIRKAKYWDGDNVKYIGEPKRHSDIYVFAYYKAETDRETAAKEITDPDKWTFIVPKTSEIDSRYGDAKTVSWKNLKAWNTPIGYGQISQHIRNNTRY